MKSAFEVNWLVNMAREGMEDVALECNPKKCAVVDVKGGVHVNGGSEITTDEVVKIPWLEEGKQYKFLGVLESVVQEDKLVL